MGDAAEEMLHDRDGLRERPDLKECVIQVQMEAELPTAVCCVQAATEPASELRKEELLPCHPRSPQQRGIHLLFGTCTKPLACEKACERAWPQSRRRGPRPLLCNHEGTACASFEAEVSPSRGGVECGLPPEWQRGKELLVKPGHLEARRHRHSRAAPLAL